MDRHTLHVMRAPLLLPWRALACGAALLGITLAAGLALGMRMNALTTVGVYFAGLLMWLALRALGGRRGSARSAQLVLAIGVVTAAIGDNTAIALTLCMIGLAGVALAVAAATGASPPGETLR